MIPLAKALLVLALGTFCYASSTFAGQVVGGAVSFDSVGQSGNPFEGGSWGNAKGGQSWTQYDLPNAVAVASIYIKSAGTDITSSNSRIEVLVKVPRGWVTVYELNDKVINRQFSGGISGPQIRPLRIKLGNAVITGVRINMSGHGWFEAEDVRLEIP